MAREQSHVPIPLPAYEDGKLIVPHEYDRKLRGAVVLISFSLIHYVKTDTGGKKDLFGADIEYMKVLVPPKRYPRTPSRSQSKLATPGIRSPQSKRLPVVDPLFTSVSPVNTPIM